MFEHFDGHEFDNICAANTHKQKAKGSVNSRYLKYYLNRAITMLKYTQETYVLANVPTTPLTGNGHGGKLVQQ